LSDRRVVRLQRLIAAAAALSGRGQPAEADLWPVIFALPTAEAQHLGRDVLRDFLAESENGALLSAPAEGSLGPRARAARILRDGTAVIEAQPDNGAGEAWRMKVEGVAREIDASFARDTLPPDLAVLRARIVAILTPGEGAGPA
jgi:MoxR-like ATPase